jgi:putative RecB family exonuclease
MTTVASKVDLEEAILTNLKETVSPSRLSLFLQCRLKFWFRYVRQIEKPKSPALHLGSCVHSTLKAWNKARWRGRTLTMEQSKAEYLLAWKGEASTVVWDGNEESFQQTGWALLELYLGQTERRSRTPEAVEVPVEADLSSAGLPRLVGIIDLVEGGIIVDYKSSASTPTPARVAHSNEIQTTAYATLYRETTGTIERGIEIHTLVKLKRPKIVTTALPAITEAQKTRLFRLIESYMEGVGRHDWVPSPGLQCSCCEYFSECRNWSA